MAASRFLTPRRKSACYSCLSPLRLSPSSSQAEVPAQVPVQVKLKVKVRHKIVADCLDDGAFDVTNKGIHVDAQRFNELIEDPDTVLVDMRNHYESEIGHFKNAVCPDVDTFRDSLDLI